MTLCLLPWLSYGLRGNSKSQRKPMTKEWDITTRALGRGWFGNHSIKDQEREWSRTNFNGWLKGLSAHAVLLKRSSLTFIKGSPTPLALTWAALPQYALTWVSLLIQLPKKGGWGSNRNYHKSISLGRCLLFWGTKRKKSIRRGGSVSEGLLVFYWGLIPLELELGEKIYQSNWERSEIPRPSSSPKQLGGKGNVLANKIYLISQNIQNSCQLEFCTWLQSKQGILLLVFWLPFLLCFFFPLFIHLLCPFIPEDIFFL